MNIPSQRGAIWFAALTAKGHALSGLCASIRVADAPLQQHSARFIAVVPNANNRYPRARQGEVGLLEGWTLAKIVQETRLADQYQSTKRPIIAIIDLPSQAYGRSEEAFGIHQALAGATAAYAQARLAGHPVIGLIVGKAMSGAFLAHGYQSHRLIAFNDPLVEIHAMGKAAAARITLRRIEELETLAANIPPMAYDITNYQKLGLLYRLLTIQHPDAPSEIDIHQVQQTLQQAIEDTQRDPSLTCRLGGEARYSSLSVRKQMRSEW